MPPRIIMGIKRARLALINDLTRSFKELFSLDKLCFFAKRIIVRLSMVTIIRAGKKPARNNALMDTPLIIPYVIIGTLGGTTTPSVPAEAAMAQAKSISY